MLSLSESFYIFYHCVHSFLLAFVTLTAEAKAGSIVGRVFVLDKCSSQKPRHVFPVID